MKLRLAWLGIAAFLLALIVVLPVKWIAGFLPAEVRCQQWTGTIWHGECAQLVVLQGKQSPLQADLLRWKLKPSALLRLAINADLQVRTPQGSGSGGVELGRNGRVAVEGLAANALFDRRLAAMLAAGWNGQLQAQDVSLRMQGMQLQALSGQLTLRDFNDGRGGALGSYRLTFAPVAAPPFAGALKDDGGPLEVNAALTITADRQWTLDGKIRPRPEAPEQLRRQLEYLGAADASGRYPLSMSGTFK